MGRVADVALAVLTDARSTWRLPDVVRELAFALPTDIGQPAEDVVAELEAGAGLFAESWLVEFAAPVHEGAVLRASDGRPVSESPLERRYTTHYILDEEERLMTWAQDRRDQLGEAPHLPAGELAGLSPAQQAAAGAVAGTEALVVIVGPAGTGKTTAMAPAVRHLQRQGRQVFGLAPSATAAAVLAEGTGLSADTIDKLLVEHERPAGPSKSFALAAGTTVIVDEAAMVATPKLAQLANLADTNGWRVVLVGDPLQFSPVGRGGMFAWLAEHGPTIELDQVHRFAEAWERDASLQLRRGRHPRQTRRRRTRRVVAPPSSRRLGRPARRLERHRAPTQPRCPATPRGRRAHRHRRPGR